MKTHSSWTAPLHVAALALLCCALWGSSYPAIKNGYALFEIGASDIPAKLLFAGWRFLMAGAIVLVVARLMGRDITAAMRSMPLQITALGLAQTTLQYVFFYVGLANTSGVKASILNGTTTFFSVLLAHWLHANDRLSLAKSLGCLIGFAGVFAVTLRGGASFSADFNWLGDGSVILAALILSAASIYGKKLSQSVDAMSMTGWQLAIGGVLLLLLGWATGGALGVPSLAAFSLLLYLALLSSIAFTVWSTLLKHNKVSRVTIFNFTVPVFGSVLSALFLGETLWAWHYLAALVLVCAGILLVTLEPAKGR